MTIAEQMRRDWDERARKDSFRYIYSDVPIDSPEAFFQSGETDYGRFVEPVLAQLEFNPASRTVLELGCGVGRMTRSFARRFRGVYAIDISSEMLRQGRDLHPEESRILWLLGDGQGLSMFADQCVDVAFSFIVLQHMPSSEISLGYVRELLRVLRPGGVFCFQFNNRHAPTMNWRGRIIWRLFDRLREPVMGLNLQKPAARLTTTLGLDPLHAGRTWHGAVLDTRKLLETVSQCGGTVTGLNGEGTQTAWCYGRKTR